MNRILAAITPVRTAFLAVGLVVGVASGAAVVGVPTIQAPHECTVMANISDGTFNAYEEQVVAVHNMATRGMSEFEENEAKVERLWVEIDGLKADHGIAKAACLGADQ